MYDIYTVLDGDTIDILQEKIGISKDDLYQLNGFSSDFVIMPGMQIVIPKRQDVNFWYYTVKKGDNLYAIAKKYGVDYPVLLALNGLDKDDYIYPNQTIVIPREDINVYLTGMDDTLEKIMNRNHVDIQQFLKENENIYLKPEQIIVFRNK